MIDCIGYGIENDKYYIQACCAEAHIGKPCDCKTYVEGIKYEKDAKFIAECIASKLNVPVQNWCPAAGRGFSNDTIKKYLDMNGTVCPVCGYSTIEGEQVEVETGTAYQKITCNHCHISWYDKYKLIGIDRIDEDD